MISPKQQQSSEYETWILEDLLKFGTTCLRKGRRYEDAIKGLRVATQKEGKSLPYESHLALGCAYSSRFSSIVEAVLMPENSITYDDSRPWKKIYPESLHYLEQLIANAKAAFDKADSLAQRESKEKQAEVSYTQGWGLSLLRFRSRKIKEWKDRDFVSQAEIVKCFQKSVDLDSTQSIYWHSLGLSYVPKYIYEPSNIIFQCYIGERKLYKEEEIKKAVMCLENAIKSRKYEANILFQLAILSSAVDIDSGLSYLDRYARTNGDNAVVDYLRALQYFIKAGKSLGEKSEKEKYHAADIIPEGNRKAGYSPISIEFPTPLWLKPPYENENIYGVGDDPHIINELATKTKEFIDTLINNKHKEKEEDILKYISILMDLGLNVIRKSTKEYDKGKDHPEPRGLTRLEARALMGIVSCYFANDLIVKSEKLRPSKQKEQFIMDNQANLDSIKTLDKKLTSPK
jgi:tetratricopeptide (TPR) repeat protein